MEALKRQVLQQRATWWQGQTYHCPLCDVDFGAAQLAAEHVVREQHPVRAWIKPLSPSFSSLAPERRPATAVAPLRSLCLY